MKIEAILSDNRPEFCGREDQHPRELFPQLEEIEHRKTKMGRPQSNGFIERFYRTLLGRAPAGEGEDDLARVRRRDAGRSRRSSRNLQPEPAHRGRRMVGRTPHQVFKKGIRRPMNRKTSNREGGETAA